MRHSRANLIGGHMIWAFIVVSSVIGVTFVKVRRQRKAAAGKVNA